MCLHFFKALDSCPKNNVIWLGYVAEEEIAFSRTLVEEVPVNTIFAVHRSIDDDGEIREQFRRIEQRIAGGPIYAKAWETDSGT